MERSNFFIEILKLMPQQYTVEIWSTEEQLREVLLPISGTGWRPFRFNLSLNAIKSLEANNMIGQIPYYFESIEIWNNGQKLFEGWDCLEFGLISRTIALPREFEDAFINMSSEPHKGRMCSVSNDW